MKNTKFRTKFKMGTRLVTVVTILAISIILSVVTALAAPLAQTTTVTVTVTDTNGTVQTGLNVYAFNGGTYTNLNATTDGNGQVIFDLPDGNYNFRADLNGTQFFSDGGTGGTDTCTVNNATPDCTADTVIVSEPVVVTVTEQGTNTPLQGVPVYAFNGTTYTNKNDTTDANGEVSLTLPLGDYNFRADVNGNRYFSGGSAGLNTCLVDNPNQTCTTDSVTIPVFETVQITVVEEGTNNPIDLVPVYVFSGTTYINLTADTDPSGLVEFTLPAGDYNFRADVNGNRYFSGGSAGVNTCTVPGCAPTTISIPVFETVQVTVVEDGTNNPLDLVPVYVFSGTTYTNLNATTDANGLVEFTLPAGDYNFRADVNGNRYFSGGSAGVNTCTVPGCAPTTISIPVFETVQVTVVEDGTNNPLDLVPVYVFSGTTYTNLTADTDPSGLVEFTLPAGSYNFRADVNGNRYFSGGSAGVNTCTVPGCAPTTIAIPVFETVVVTVDDGTATPPEGVPVYVFNGTTYTNLNDTTDANGQVSFILPAEDYNFRADLNGVQYFSGGASRSNTCTVPGCTADTVTVAVFGTVVVTVADTNGVPQEGLPVYAFSGITYTNRTADTDVNGLVEFTLPAGDYNFRSDLNGTQFFSGGPNRPDTCTTPTCTTDSITVTTPVVVTVIDTNNAPQVGVPVYAYSGPDYANKQTTTDTSGQATLTLLPGDYNFRADVNGNSYFSGGTSGVNTCQVNDPNQICVTDTVTVPAPFIPQADLSVTKVVDKANPTGNDTIVYTIQVTNNGTEDATGVVLTDTLPLEITYSGDDSGDAYNGTNWAVGNLISGTTATLNITATVNGLAPGSVVTNTVEVSGDQTDLNSGNNSANAEFTVTTSSTGVTVTVTSANGGIVPNQLVQVYTVDASGVTTPTNISDTTNISGTVIFTLTDGDYLFSTIDTNGANYSSSTCTTPTCTSADLFLFSAVEVSVIDTTGAELADQIVYVFDDTLAEPIYQNISDTTTVSGTVSFNLDSGNYMFYAYDANGNGYGSVPVPCTAPDCAAATITLPTSEQVEVTVTDGLNTIPGKPVQVYTVDVTSGATATTTLSDTTNISGTVTFTLVEGSYQFAADDDLGTTFFSPTCTVTTCTNVSLVLAALDAVTVTVEDTTGALLEDRIVYVLDSTGAETGITDTTNISGTVNFNLPPGDYTFAADSGDRYFSPLCTLPGCTDALITLPAPVTLPAATCTESGGVRTCDLWATSGTLDLPDGNTVDIWGYTDVDPANGGTAQLPGPMIIANQGETIQVNLHNNLPNSQATSILFKGLNMVPDLNGVGSGGTTTYTVDSSNPGTYLYQAGLTDNGIRQVAMGMFGALVIRPVDGSGPILNEAYGNGNTFENEALLVLSEIDPRFNNAADKNSFDIRDFEPQYWLINGKAYPQTSLVLAEDANGDANDGNKVLLRYLNAGLSHHSMGVLGTSQTLLGSNGSPLPGARNVTAETLAPGQTLDAIVSIPSGVEPGSRFALHDTNLLLHNAGDDGFGGMLTFVATLDNNAAQNPGGPATLEVILTPDSTTGGSDVDINALVSDVDNGGDTIQIAEFFVGSPGDPGTGTALSASDGTFDSPTEDVNGTIPSSALNGLSSGNYNIYVHGQDDQGNWGSFHPVVLHLDKAGPASTGLELNPNPGGGSGNVTLTGTADDRFSGNSNVVAARYSVAGLNGAMNVNVNAPIASLSADIDVTGLAEGVHTVSVESQDEFGYWGPAGTIDLMVDQTGPNTVLVELLPDANNGTLPVNASLFSMRVNATISDTVISDVQSGIKAVEGFIDYQPGVDQDGTGFPLTPADGRYNNPTENAYAFIPLSTINALADGVHTIGIHGQDASGNWGEVVNAQLIIDKGGPTVSGLTATPNPTNGAGTTDLAATATDAATNVALAEWFAGADPGQGNGMPMAVAFNGTDWNLTTTIDLSGWADGDYTISVRARDAAGNWSTPVSLTLSVTDAPTPVADQLYFSTVGGGNNNPVQEVPGPYDDADIYHWDGAVGGNAFTRFFDGTAKGLPGNADIDGLKIDGDVYYMSFKRNGGTNVPGLGTVQDEDIVIYDPVGDPDNPWDFIFQGIDTCLGTSNGQDVDAFDVVGGVVYFSTLGGGNNNPVQGVPGPYDDADIYTWNGTACDRVFDARGAGGNLLPGYADIVGLTVVDADTFYMSFNSATTNVSGLGAVQDEDVVLYDKGVWSVFFDGTERDLANSGGQDLDAIDVKW